MLQIISSAIQLCVISVSPRAAMTFIIQFHDCLIRYPQILADPAFDLANRFRVRAAAEDNAPHVHEFFKEFERPQRPGEGIEPDGLTY